METPGASIFQGTNISINKSRNEEEEEDLEDQKRRNEELQNLLMTKLDDFNYDESTMNSSIISTISIDDARNEYLTAENANDQIKVLYEVRGRELQALREEYKNVVENKTKQINDLKKKLTLTEAELEQIKVSYKNSEELLVEKVESIKELTSILESKEKQIELYRKDTENLHLEVATYKSTIEDIHRQMQGDRNPFANSNKHFNSEELKTAHKEQIDRLENLLEEKTRLAKHSERENQALKQELNKVIESNSDNSKLIETLTRNFEDAQKQCENLIDVIETLSNENNHLQNRVNNVYNHSPGKRNSLDINSLVSHVDKLKKMLVDKSVQINTLGVKLNNYEANLKELLEYRKLKSDAYQKEFQQCENEDHTKNLLLMQNDLQNYRRIIEDKNQQILNLNSTNKDLLAKMEETLSQTRNDIQKFSAKYSLPQLDKMAQDLKTSERHITELQEKLKHSEEQRLHLAQEDKNKEKEHKEELEALKLISEKDRNNFENEIKKLHNELSISLNEITNLKQHIQELSNENSKLQSQLNIGFEDTSVKKQYLESIQALRDARNEVKRLQETVDELRNLKTIAEGDRCTFEFEAKDAKYKLESVDKYLSKLEKQLDQATEDLQSKDQIINTLQKNVADLTKKLNTKSSEIVEKECSCKNSLQNNKEPLSDKKIRRNLDAELKAVEELDRDNEANMISLELKIREEIQKEYFDKLIEIEETYQKACNSSNALCKEKIHKLKNQESKFREHLSVISNECRKRIEEFETDREDLIKNINTLQNQFAEFKKYSKFREDNFRKLIEDLENKNKTEGEKWKLWSQKLINSCLKIETVNKKSRDNILFKMQRYDSNVEVVEKAYEKAKKKLTKNK